MCAFGECVPSGQWAKPTHFAKQHIDRKVSTFCKAAHLKFYILFQTFLYLCDVKI